MKFKKMQSIKYDVCICKFSYDDIYTKNKKYKYFIKYCVGELRAFVFFEDSNYRVFNVYEFYAIFETVTDNRNSKINIVLNG